MVNGNSSPWCPCGAIYYRQIPKSQLFIFAVFSEKRSSAERWSVMHRTVKNCAQNAAYLKMLDFGVYFALKKSHEDFCDLHPETPKFKALGIKKRHPELLSPLWQYIEHEILHDDALRNNSTAIRYRYITILAIDNIYSYREQPLLSGEGKEKGYGIYLLLWPFYFLGVCGGLTAL